MDNEVEYSDNSIVSRQVVKESGGNVSLFAFDAGQELSEHTAPFDAFVSILDGQAAITIGSETETLKAGETVCMPANVPHALHAIEQFKMLLVLIKK